MAAGQRAFISINSPQDGQRAWPYPDQAHADIVDNAVPYEFLHSHPSTFIEGMADKILTDNYYFS